MGFQFRKGEYLMRNRTEWLIYGSGLSALILAERLGSAGKEVTLLNPTKSWGGIFNGIKLGNEQFDAGMTNFEFDLFAEPEEDLQKYIPDQKRDVGRYVHFVKNYLSKFTKFVPISTPQMIFKDTLFEDLIISNRFEVLNYLPTTLKESIRKELEAIVLNPNPLHPRTKYNRSSLLETTQFKQASVANHGSIFHDLFIEPMFQKVLGISTNEVEAIFHRNGWVPFYHPETLLNLLSNNTHRLKPTIFNYPTDKYFGAFINRITDKVISMPNVKIFYSQKDIKIDLISSNVKFDTQDLYFNRIAWGGELQQLTGETPKKLELPRRADLDLFFLNVNDKGISNNFSVVIDPESSSPFYRITNQTICSGLTSSTHKIILECNSCNLIDKEDKNNKILNSALVRYGINPASVINLQKLNFKGALIIPSFEDMSNFRRKIEQIKNSFPHVNLIGTSSGYVSVTLNDHVIQALQIAQLEGALN